MALTRDEKNQLVESVAADLEKCRAVIFTEYHGITMKDTQNMRKKLRGGNVTFKVIKTTLLNLAMKKAKLSVPSEVLNKPLAIAIGMDDEVVSAKLINDSAKEIEALKVVGGIIDGQYVDGDVIKRLALLPGRDELLGRVVGTLAAPMNGLMSVLQGNIRALMVILQQRQAQL